MDREASGDADEQLDVVDREVELIGPLDEAQRARLMEIADRCPVHRTLEAGVRVRTVEG
jgi:putative redox protein